MPLRCRMGASAILLSNKRSWVRSGKAKYVLTKALRVHLGHFQRMLCCSLFR